VSAIATRCGGNFGRPALASYGVSCGKINRAGDCRRSVAGILYAVSAVRALPASYLITLLKPPIDPHERNGINWTFLSGFAGNLSGGTECSHRAATEQLF